jgi:uncharacterized protein YecE (DUF72 family)
MECAPERLDRTLRAFVGRVPVAVELRHRSWFVEETYQLLRHHGAAFVLADRRGPTTPLVTTAPWTYVRMHEGRSSPAPCYGDRALHTWADRLAELGPAGADGWVFFNNDQRACAVRNAAAFAELAVRPGPAARQRDQTNG